MIQKSKVALAMMVLGFFTVGGYCGGLPVKFKMAGFEVKGNDEFRIILSHIEGFPRLFEVDKPVIFHLRYSVPPRERVFQVSSKEYLECINILLGYYKSGQDFYLSIGGTPTKISGRANEFQSDGLFIGKGPNRDVLDTVTAIFFLPGPVSLDKSR